MEQIKERGLHDKQQAPETYKEISALSNIEDYSPEKCFGEVLPEQFMKNLAEKYPNLSFTYDYWKEQVAEWGLTDFPTSLAANSDDIASGISQILDIYKTGNIGTDFSKITSYAQYVPHVYRTFKMADNLKSSKSILDALDKIVRNVPEIMTEEELKDFLNRLGF